jgi:hypothetical protein
VNTLVLVCDVVRGLSSFGIAAIVGGGWAEELQGLIRPREHQDIDLFVVCADFERVDAYLARDDVVEIIG